LAFATFLVTDWCLRRWRFSATFMALMTATQLVNWCSYSRQKNSDIYTPQCRAGPSGTTASPSWPQGHRQWPGSAGAAQSAPMPMAGSGELPGHCRVGSAHGRGRQPCRSGGSAPAPAQLGPARPDPATRHKQCDMCPTASSVMSPHSDQSKSSLYERISFFCSFIYYQ